MRVLFNEASRENNHIKPSRSKNLHLIASPELSELMGTVYGGKNASEDAADDLGTTETRTRFENLIVAVLSQIVESRMVVLVRMRYELSYLRSSLLDYSFWTTCRIWTLLAYHCSRL